MKNIYQHFRPEEKIFIDQSMDMVHRVVDNYMTVLTDFINPRQFKILESIANSEDISLYSSEIIVNTEMVRVILAPDYYKLDPNDFEISLIDVDFPSKFSNIRHAQILGTLLGETGLDRSKIGDVLISNDKAQFFIEDRFENLVVKNISKIGKLGVKLKQVSFDNVLKFDTSYDSSNTKVLVVSSIRLDKIIAATFNISRTIASSLVEKDLVKVNYMVITKKDYLLDEGDLISVRGYGRIVMGAQLSLSKKDKIRIEVKITRSK